MSCWTRGSTLMVPPWILARRERTAASSRLSCAGSAPISGSFKVMYGVPSGSARSAARMCSASRIGESASVAWRWAARIASCAFSVYRSSFIVVNSIVNFAANVKGVRSAGHPLGTQENSTAAEAAALSLSCLFARPVTGGAGYGLVGDVGPRGPIGQAERRLHRARIQVEDDQQRHERSREAEPRTRVLEEQDYGLEQGQPRNDHREDPRPGLKCP